MNSAPRSVASQHDSADQFQQFAAWLAESLRDRDLRSEFVYPARELVDMTDLEGPDRESFLLLITGGFLVVDRGSTCLSLHRQSLRNVISKMTGDEATHTVSSHLDRIEDILKEQKAVPVVGEDSSNAPVIFDGNNLYLRRLYCAETRIADYFKQQLTQSPRLFKTSELKEALETVIEASDYPLTEHQVYGVLTALHQPVSLICGGPGTGKTTLVVSLIRLLNRLETNPSRIAIAAPTGKAADKLQQSIASQLTGAEGTDSLDSRLLKHLPSPQTVHRLLEYSPKRDTFRRHTDNPLEYETIIIDESSMLDIYLLESLVDALPSNHRLVLVGDPDQLPAVEAGAIFQELVPSRIDTNVPWRDIPEGTVETQSCDESLASHTSILQKNFRLQSEDNKVRQIAELADNINRGHLQNLTSDGFHRCEDPEDIDHRGVELLSPTTKYSFNDQLRRFVDWWYRQIVALTDEQSKHFQSASRYDSSSGFSSTFRNVVQQRMSSLDASQILTFTNLYLFGADRLNEAFHEIFRRKASIPVQSAFLPGEPVMVTENDYDRGLYNGDQGLIAKIQFTDESEPVHGAVFQGKNGLLAYPLTAIRDLIEYAYAITIHKAQGSEFNHVALVLPNRDLSVTSRELLYTGVTRCKTSALFVGSKRRLQEAIRRPATRHSGLSKRL